MVHADFWIQDDVRTLGDNGVSPLAQRFPALHKCRGEGARGSRFAIFNDARIENMKRKSPPIEVFAKAARDGGPHRLVVDLSRHDRDLDRSGAWCLD